MKEEGEVPGAVEIGQSGHRGEVEIKQSGLRDGFNDTRIEVRLIWLSQTEGDFTDFPVTTFKSAKSTVVRQG